jgi:hypothetical protein
MEVKEMLHKIAISIMRLGAAIIILGTFCAFFFAAMIGYWWYLNTFTLSTTMLDSHIVGSNVVKTPAKLTVAYIITRYKACTLDVQRIVEHINRKTDAGDQEFQVMYVVQSFQADPKNHMKSQYTADIPSYIPPGKYIIFSRVRYFCNGLDDWVPRYLVTPGVPFTVVK